MYDAIKQSWVCSMWVEPEDLKDLYRFLLGERRYLMIDRCGLIRWDNGIFMGSVGFRKILCRYYNTKGLKKYEEV